MMSFQKYKKRALRNKATQSAYKDLEPEFVALLSRKYSKDDDLDFDMLVAAISKEIIKQYHGKKIPTLEEQLSYI